MLAILFLTVCVGGYTFTSLTKLQNDPCVPYGLCPSGDCIAKETDC